MYKKRRELEYAWAACRGGVDMYPAYPATIYINEFFGMTLGERAHIVRLGALKSFKPDTAPPSKEFQEKYSQEWWDKNVVFERDGQPRNGDTCNFITNMCMFKERIQPEWKPPVIEPIDFYSPITKDNALNWYESCPLHLRAKLEKEMEKYPEAEKAAEGSDMYKRVKCLWGNRPVVRSSKEEGLLSSYEELEWLYEWLHEYDRQVATEVILTHGAAIQQERKMLNEAMGINKDDGDFPMQSDGLDATQAATIRWLQHQGQTPLEFLADTYKNDEAKMGDRITAARTLMEYIHRKIPSVQKVEQDVKLNEVKLSGNLLKGLTQEELGILEALLNKANKL